MSLLFGGKQFKKISYIYLLLLLLLSCFSCVQLCVTPQMAAHQAPPSLGFSRQEHWSGLPFPSQMHESEVAQSCPTLSNPMDCSPPASSIHGIFSQSFSVYIFLSGIFKDWLLNVCRRIFFLNFEDKKGTARKKTHTQTHRHT